MTILTDKFFIAILLTEGILLATLIIENSINIFKNLNFYGENFNLPFMVYAFPLLVISFNTLLSEGLFSYKKDYLVAYKYKIKLPLQFLTIESISKNKFSIVKAKIRINDDIEIKKNVKIFNIRVTEKNFQNLSKLLQK